MAYNKIPKVVYTTLGKGLTPQWWRKMAANPGELAANIILASTMGKDAINCGYYTYQSYNNERIPEEKRVFVSAMDLANGVLNVGLGFLFGNSVKRKSVDTFDKWFGKSYENWKAKAMTKLELSKNSPDKYALDLVNTVEKKYKKIGKAGFQALAVLAVSQIIVKRVITPFIATPAATYLNGVADKKLKKQGKTPSEGHVLDYVTIPAGSLNNTFRGFMDPTYKKEDAAAKTEEKTAK